MGWWKAFRHQSPNIYVNIKPKLIGIQIKKLLFFWQYIIGNLEYSLQGWLSFVHTHTRTKILFSNPCLVHNHTSISKWYKSILFCSKIKWQKSPKIYTHKHKLLDPSSNIDAQQIN
jgi:hypothetical protein